MAYPISGMVSEIVDKARKLFKAGQLPRAARACRQALGSDPGHVPAWFLLGLVSQEGGRSEEAQQAYREAIRLRPDHAEAHNNLGICLARQGNLPEATKCFRLAVEHRPNYPEAHNNLANSLRDQGTTDEAIEHYRTAIRLSPQYPEAQNNLGVALSRQQRWEEAAECYRTTLALRPNFAEAHNNFGIVLVKLQRYSEAVDQFEEALRLKPAYADAQGNLGQVHFEQGRWPEAVVAFRQAIKLAPRSQQWHYNLGRALTKKGEMAEAAECFRQAVGLTPQFVEGHKNLGGALKEQGDLRGAAEAFQQAVRLDRTCADTHHRLGEVLAAQGKFSEALRHFDRAIELRPDHAAAHVSRGLTRLLTGEFESGWTEHEWRTKSGEGPARDFKAPRWNGEPLNGKRILLHAEERIGDTLQFVRYARLVKQRGGTVLLQAQRSLVQLLKGCPFIDKLLAEDDELPQFDLHAPLLSLAKVFGTTTATIPAGEPYLYADADLVDHWRRELPFGESFKIGIHWQAETNEAGGRGRSLPLAHFAPIASLPQVRLFSLQKGASGEQLHDAAFSVTDFGCRLDEVAGPFMDTAAIMRNLDLVITADSAIAHLAGGLGVPVWLALPHVPDCAGCSTERIALGIRA